MFSIYAIIDKITNRAYVGMTSRSPNKRFAEHCGNRNTFISSQIRSLGKQNFILKVLAQTESLSSALDIELHKIIKNNTLAPKGFNIQCRGKSKYHFFAERAGQLDLWS
jgi:hypothetical protein